MTAALDEPTGPMEGELLPGTMLGRYQIVRRVGRGGVGAVYEARHVDLEKRVALKTLHPEYARDPGMRARFVAEGRAASRLQHPHVVDVSDYGVEGEVAFLVMEYLEGEDLGSLLAREGALPIERIVSLLVPICAAVSAAHEAGVVHRDLKPENIFLARNALGQLQPRVLDFGISKVLDAREEAVTGAHDLVGTPCYLSPEHAHGDHEPDARSDQYALGVILYECATGRLPFEADTLPVLLRKVAEGVYTPPRARCPSLPPRFERVIVRAMQRAPERRYPSVRALARDLLAFGPALARVTWEPVIVSPDATDADEGEDPTATFVSPRRRAFGPRPKVDTLDSSARELATPPPALPRPRPRRRGGAVVAWSALATMAVVGVLALLHHAHRGGPAPRGVRATVPTTVEELVRRPPPVAPPVAPSAPVPAVVVRADEVRPDEVPVRARRSRGARRHERRHRSELRSGG